MLGQRAALPAGGARHLFGEMTRGVFDRDDVRGAQDPESQHTAAGML
jgi:hypothetical protein